MRRTALLLVAVLSAVSLTACGGSKDDVVATWFDQTAAAAATQGGPDPVPSRTWALAWWAADRAVAASPDDAAAVATAVHDVLLALVPARREQLDRALGDVDDAAGHREAAAVLAERAGDGLTAAQLNRPVTLPAPGPGVYRSTGEPPAQGGQGDARPFLLRSTGEVAVVPPPALASAAYARDLDEVRRLGERGSAERTPAQTALATFWGPSLVGLLTPGVRAAVVGRDPRSAASLLSDLHRILLDAQLAGYRAKYDVLHWRPVTAIGGGWTPLLATPPTPDHPSGHTVYAAALATVLQQRVGDLPFALGERRYTRWQQVVDENVDARVWAGVHFRSADVAGADLGRRVAELGLVRLAA